MYHFLSELFANVNENSRVFIFVPYHLLLPDYRYQYKRLFFFLKQKTNTYPEIVYHSQRLSGSIHMTFIGLSNFIKHSNNTLAWEADSKKGIFDAYKTAFFYWDYPDIASYLRNKFNIKISRIAGGGFYFLHLPAEGDVEFKVITRQNILDAVNNQFSMKEG